jgi:DNA-binding response OmpR family regulator
MLALRSGDAPGTQIRPAGPDFTRGTPVEATIVVAEDDPNLRKLYAEWLRRAGHRVWVAADGAEAVAQVCSCKPDLLLLDIWMPILNGLEVLERLRRTDAAVGLRVVVLSCLDDADTHLEGYSLGITDYWTKDLSLTELSRRVEALLGPAPSDLSPPEDR